MMVKNTQIAHFGVLQSAFWRQNPRPPPPPYVDALEPLDSMDTSSSHQDWMRARSQQPQPKHPAVKNATQTSQSSSPHTCPNIGCSKSFMRKEHLNRHLVTHTGVRPFKCNVCKRSFTRRLGYSSLRFVNFSLSLRQSCSNPIYLLSYPLLWHITSSFLYPITLVLLSSLTYSNDLCSQLTVSLRVSSDVLRRHTLQHSTTLPPSRTPTACAQCHRRKLRCDSNNPCQTCTAAGTECVRKASSEHKAVERSMSRNSAVSSTSDFPTASSSR